MPFDARTFSLAKDAEHPDENQDACRLDAAVGRAVIADGVATGIFSRRWAELLVEAVLAGPPDPDDAESFAAWLAERRQAWSQGIDVDRLPWFQKPKMRQGAFSTLLWTWLVPDTDSAPGVYRLHARAIGDSCLLLVREGEMLETFPLTRPEQFDADPVVLGSLDLGRDQMARFRSLDIECRTGDLVVLATDAVAQWALRRREQEDPPDWDQFWDMTATEWHDEIADLRSRQQMRYDDATLALLRVVDAPVEPRPEEPPDREIAEPTGLPTPPAVPVSREASEPPVLPEPPAVPVSPETPIAGPAAQPVSPAPSAPAPLRPPPVPSDDSVELDPQQPPPASSDWRARLKALSDDFVHQAGEQITRGIEQIKKATHSADEAIRKYREKLRSRDRKDK